MNKKYFYCYNYQQSDFFVKNGCPVLEIGKGNNGDIYVKFPRNEFTEQIFQRWIERGKLVNF